MLHYTVVIQQVHAGSHIHSSQRNHWNPVRKANFYLLEGLTVASSLSSTLPDQLAQRWMLSESTSIICSWSKQLGMFPSVPPPQLFQAYTDPSHWFLLRMFYLGGRGGRGGERSIAETGFFMGKGSIISFPYKYERIIRKFKIHVNSQLQEHPC